jgi:hypothetical protein
LARRCLACKPKRHRIDYPGGFVWRHESTCPDYPNQRVGKERAHPAGSARSRAEEQWQSSPLIGPLDYWASYFDEALDSEDDERQPLKDADA